MNFVLHLLIIQFHMKFTLQFNWIPTEAVYKSMYKASIMAQREQKPEILQNWVPDWIPLIKFDNVYKVIRQEWVPHPANPEKGPFRLATYYGTWGGYNVKKTFSAEASGGKQGWAGTDNGISNHFF